MTALFIAPRVPLVDPNTGLCTPIWYRFLSDFFTTNGATTVIDENAFEVFPMTQVDSFSALIPQEGGDLSPVPMGFVAAADDVAPRDDLIGMIAALQTQIDDLKKGITL